jgi:EmrB/QacA subfamily drug resistance transporter
MGDGDAARTGPDPEALAQARRVLGTVCLAVSIVYLDLFIVNIAFPDIARDFRGASVADLSWVLNAYAIVFAALLVPAGRLADRAGRRKGFVIGLVVFVVASALCAAAPSVAVLVAARVLQAVGAAIMLPTSLALVLVTYPAEKRAAAIAAWSAVGGVAAGLGPPLGGVLVELDWRWVFLVNLPIGAVAVVLALRVLPESRVPGPVPDLLGSAMAALSIGGLAFALVNGPDWGWGDARVVTGFAASAVLGAAFLARSARHPSPVVELAMLRVRSFALASWSALAFNAGFAAMLLGNTLFVIVIWGWSVLEAGVAIVPGPLTAAVVSGFAPALARRLGSPVTIALGCALYAAAALSWVWLVGPEPDYVGELLPGTILTGAGIGLVFPIVTEAATASLPAVRYATGSAVLQMARQIGAVLGVAILVAIIGTPTPFDGVGDFERSWVFMAISALVAGAAALAIGRRPAAGPAPAGEDPRGPGEPAAAAPSA